MYFPIKNNFKRIHFPEDPGSKSKLLELLDTHENCCSIISTLFTLSFIILRLLDRMQMSNHFENTRSPFFSILRKMLRVEIFIIKNVYFRYGKLP